MPTRARARALKPVYLLLFLLALLAPLAPAHAQSQAAGGEIEGTVADETGGVLPGVAVTISLPRRLAT